MKIFLSHAHPIQHHILSFQTIAEQEGQTIENRNRKQDGNPSPIKSRKTNGPQIALTRTSTQ
jgi:hypothetical protein